MQIIRTSTTAMSAMRDHSPMMAEPAGTRPGRCRRRHGEMPVQEAILMHNHQRRLPRIVVLVLLRIKITLRP